MKDRRVIAFVFARGGSKGLPGKNLLILNGTSLVGRAVKCAHACPAIDHVVISTDDNVIAENAVVYGAQAPFLRPAHLAEDSCPEWLAWQHAITEMGDFSNLKHDIFVSIPPTAPLRAPEDIQACIDLYLEGNHDIVVTAKPAARHPSFNMVRIEDGTANLVLPLSASLHRRQDAPEVFDMTTVAYVARPSFILEAKGVFDGRVGVCLVPEERAIDIDTPFDFRLAEFLLSDSKAPGVAR